MLVEHGHGLDLSYFLAPVHQKSQTADIAAIIRHVHDCRFFWHLSCFLAGSLHMTSRPIERPARKHLRMPCLLSAQGQRFEATSTNVSAGGFCVYLEHSELGRPEDILPVGTRLSATFQPPDDPLVADIEAQVIWIEPAGDDLVGRGTSTLGLRFCEPEHPDLARLHEMLRDLRYTIVVIDDEPANLEFLSRCLESEYRVVTYESPTKALADFAENQFDVEAIICDQRMPRLSGSEFFKQLSRMPRYARVSRVAITAFPEADDLQELINEAKIFHVLAKPVKVDDLLLVVRRAVDAYLLLIEAEDRDVLRQRLEQENAELRQQVVEIQGVDALVGTSAPMRAIVGIVEQIAPQEATVLLRGDTGTGKELLARMVHALSPRRDQPFIAVNCAALPEGLIESELFGHERGAFTGATGRHLGRFERAQRGTLFIDEVGDLPQSVQTKLLRVLQERSFERIGGRTPLKADVRVIAATHRNLEELMEDGRFREDLFYRLNVVPIFVPSLVQRREDIWPLAVHYLELLQRRMGKHGIKISSRMRLALESHPWPGNVRELINLVERLVVLTPNNSTADWTEIRARAPRRSWTGPLTADVQGTLQELMGNFERRVLGDALKRTNGNRTRAAGQLGISRQTLQFKIVKHKL
jgi:DNA-binding NtrC family response regulator